MKISAAIALLALAPLSLAAPGASLESIGLPSMPPLADYLRMAERSPFSGRAATTIGHGTSGVWELWGLMQISGKNYAILRHTDTKQFLYLTEKINSQGLRLVSVDYNPDPRKETVTIESNGVPTRLGYAAELLAEKFSAYQKLEPTQTAPKP